MFSKVLLPFCTAFFILCISSCETDSGSKLPIEEEALIKVLTDIHIMEGALQNQKSSEKDSLAEVFYNQVYEKHDISESHFVSSLEIMKNNPKLIQEIYEQVLVEMDSIEEKSYKSKYKKNKAPKSEG